jgi:ferredoxin, 2Fe-2S
MMLTGARNCVAVSAIPRRCCHALVPNRRAISSLHYHQNQQWRLKSSFTVATPVRSTSPTATTIGHPRAFTTAGTGRSEQEEEDDDDANTKIHEYLTNEVGIVDNENKTLHASIITAIADNHGGKDHVVTVSDLQSLGPATLQALAESVAATPSRKRKTRNKRPVPSLSIRLDLPDVESGDNLNDVDDRSVDIDWRVGEKLLAAIKRYDDQLLEATCGGQASCSTCHVYLKEVQQQKSSSLSTSSIIDIFPPPDENEQDMIDLAYQPNSQGVSRLACQIRLSPSVVEEDATPTGDAVRLIVQIPNDVHNLWDR